MEHRPLGASGISVSALALGSWQTWERIPREQGVAVLQAARAAGISFLEVARYDDTLGSAPIPTGYSEVVFGELLRASRWPRDELFLANKLWWEFWPEQSAEQELDASLERTGLERFDFLYSDPPPAELAMERVVAAVTDLIGAGRIRAWGIVNWPPERLAEAARVAAGQGVPAPCAAQLPYSLALRSVVEDPAMEEALDACRASLVPSAVLAGGVLTGKYADGGSGRLTDRLDDPRVDAAAALVESLRAEAAERGTTPAALAIAFALAHPRSASVLFGATSPEQVAADVAALAL
jgi:aryl-alcohol dehydrogenase-like predicted oxidoreductase